MKTLEIARVEFGNIIRSNKFHAIVVIFTLTLFSGLCKTMEPVFVMAPGGPAPPTMELGPKVMEVVGDYIYMLVPLVAIILGFDAISSKVEKGIARTLLTQPVFRDNIIVGTFIAGLISLSASVIIPLALSLSLTVLLLGITPSLADITLLANYMGLVAVFALAYYALSVFFSTISGSSVKSLIACIIVWLFSSLILPRLSVTISRLILGPPVFKQMQMGPQIVWRIDPEYMKKYMALRNKILFLSLDHHFSATQMQLLYGLSIKDYTGLIILIAFSVVVLVSSFIIFVKREVR